MVLPLEGLPIGKQLRSPFSMQGYSLHTVCGSNQTEAPEWIYILADSLECCDLSHKQQTLQEQQHVCQDNYGNVDSADKKLRNNGERSP